MNKTYKDYINDPSIINEPMPLREVHAIRLKINDETKDMTPEERTAFIKKRTEPIIKKYNLKIASFIK